MTREAAPQGRLVATRARAYRPEWTAREGGVTLSDVLAELERATGYRPRRSGSGYLARCPAHDDRRPSLSVAEGRDGRVLINCFANCDWPAIVSALGLERKRERDDRPRRRARPCPPPPPEPLPSEEEVAAWHRSLMSHPRALARLAELRGWTPEAIVELELGLDADRVTIPVRDAEGELANVLRYQPNPARRRGPKLLALRGRPRELYPAPERYAPDELLLVVEGEPDAIAGVSLGLAAVGIPGAAGWRPAWRGRFRGRRVALLLDADEPGRALAVQVASDLRGVASVAVLDVAELEPGAHDLTDAALRRRSREAA